MVFGREIGYRYMNKLRIKLIFFSKNYKHSSDVNFKFVF
jgi:hypothetical protein